ncbi:phosphatase PAP2 family protein [Actinomadura parmotrematis]|uniref:Phosphatase PAP2 family protein n=1 Tax=Actinomadura parmotrematis TaxID=2864039 RepID=A0ABS7FVH3_9ACTN|nr:phosphatase PAP2 family protein [Actinomadura parmotrematis]MBW8484430.1 phosphatase PAP2 family protein [Actinomadura parmotrematis]
MGKVAGHDANWADRADRIDERLLEAVVARRTPLLERWMPRTSRVADHLVVWWGVAAVLAAAGGPDGRRAARRGVVAMLAVGPVCNLIGKQVVDRDRPPRRLRERTPGRVPDSGAFPSGHTAAAAAFTTAVGLTLPWAGVPAVALTMAVGYSRLYTCAHYPSDVVAGAAAGTAMAVALHRVALHRARHR